MRVDDGDDVGGDDEQPTGINSRFIRAVSVAVPRPPPARLPLPRPYERISNHLKDTSLR